MEIRNPGGELKSQGIGKPAFIYPRLISSQFPPAYYLCPLSINSTNPSVNWQVIDLGELFPIGDKFDLFYVRVNTINIMFTVS
jgi:hypothetical protein